MSKDLKDLPTEINIQNIRLTSNPSPEVHFETLSTLEEYRIESFFKTYLYTLGEKGIGIALLFDEYEHMMRHTFGGEEGTFFPIRTISSEPPINLGSPKPLTYIISGAMPWNQLCQMAGSPELNNIGSVLYVGPIESSDFQKMWSQCLSNCSEDVQKRIMGTNLEADDIYELTGGWPFYGKVVGHQLSSQYYKKDMFYEALLQHFGVIWNRLTDYERKELIGTDKGITIDTGTSTRKFLRLGLIEEGPDGQLRLRGQLWTQFVREQIPTEEANEVIIPRQLQPKDPINSLTLLVDDIAVLITEINETNINLHNSEVFCCSNQDVHIYRDLRKPAYDSEQFAHFSLSLYNLIYERTTGTRLVKGSANDSEKNQKIKSVRSLERLPKNFATNVL